MFRYIILGLAAANSIINFYFKNYIVGVLWAIVSILEILMIVGVIA